MNKTQKRDRIFLLYGKTAYQAQLLEEQLLQLLLDRKWTADAMPTKIIEEEDKKLRNLTLGQLGAGLKKHFPNFTHFSQHLEKIKEDRNYLAHRFFRDFRFHLEWGSDYEQEQRKLEYLHSELEQCTTVVEKFRTTLAVMRNNKP